MKFKRIAIDMSKHVFAPHGVDEREHPVLRRDLEHGEVDAILTNPETGFTETSDLIADYRASSRRTH